MPSPKPSLLHVVGAAIVRGDRCLVAKRGQGGAAAGKWEFPGGKIEPGEAAAEALVREIDEELGLRIEVGAHLGRGSDDRIVLDVYAGTLVAGALTPREHEAVLWASGAELEALDWAAPDIPIVPTVIALLRDSHARTS